MYRVNCSHPQYIVNPSIRTFIRLCKYFTVFDDSCYVCGLAPTPKILHLKVESIHRILCGENPLNVFKIVHPRQFDPDGGDFSFDYASSFHFIDDNGQFYDLFVQVKCGHCEICRNSYVNSLRQRVMFQIQQVPTVPWFVTLTVAPEHVSKRGPDVRCIQLFKKRLKAVLSREFHYSPDLVKFVVVSENGKYVSVENGKTTIVNKNNLHYHLLVLGFPPLHKDGYTNLLRTCQVFNYCWRFPDYFDKDGKEQLNPISFKEYNRRYPLVFHRPKGYDPFSRGYVNCKQVDSSSKALNYILKYVTKGCDNDPRELLDGIDPLTHKKYHYRSLYDCRGWRKHFCLVSQNMGLDFAKSLAVRPDGKVHFTNWLDNTLYVVNLSSYFINKLFPSFSKLVPCYIRRQFDFCVEEIAKLLDSCFCDRHLHKTLVSTSEYLVANFPFLDDWPHYVRRLVDYSDEFAFNQSLSLVSNAVSVLYAWIVETDFDLIRKRCLARDEFLSKFKPKTDFDVGQEMHLQASRKYIQTTAKL